MPPMPPMPQIELPQGSPSHTPAPWLSASYRLGDGSEEGYVVQQQRGREIARLPHSADPELRRRDAAGEQYRNAALAAAAPEMFALLFRFQHATAGVPNTGSAQRDAEIKLQWLAQIASQAAPVLAKAMGLPQEE